MIQILVVTQETEYSTIVRCRAVSDVKERLNKVEGNHTETSSTSETVFLQALQYLSQAGLLTFRQQPESVTELWYIPSRKSRQSVWDSEPQLGLTVKILHEHRNQFRISEGAVFRFPFVGSTDFIEAFITDWSPFPAAVAIAVHKDHALTRNLRKKSGNYFTGKFVRHPLTGDILPVWVADWVKPEFGTGAVIVNPAHDSTDLEFAQNVGLPIRFALVHQMVNSNPETWPDPPIIRQGTTTKTGQFDGLSPSEAVKFYFESLIEHNFAKKCTDIGVGAWKIASYQPSSDGNALVIEGEDRFMSVGSVGIKKENKESAQTYKIVKIEPNEVFRSLLSIGNDTSLELVVPKAEIDTTLLFARLIWFDLKDHPLVPEQIISVQKVEKTKESEELALEDLKLASIVKFPLNQVAVIKQQVVDQTKSFNRRHQELLINTTTLSDFTDDPQGTLWKQIVKTKSFLLKFDLQNAFSSLFSVQKAISTLSFEAQSADMALSGYYTLAYILTGCQYPESLVLSEVWKRI